MGVGLAVHTRYPRCSPATLSATLAALSVSLNLPDPRTQITMPVDVTKTRMQLGGAAGVQAYTGL